MPELTPPRHITYRPLGELQGNPVNPKAHDDDAIGDSLAAFGYIDAVIVDERTGYLVGGHGRTDRLAAMRDAGAAPPDGVEARDGDWWVPVQRGWSSRDDAHAAAALVALNKVGERGGWDPDLLPVLLDRITDVDPALLLATGFTDADVTALARDADTARAAATGTEGDDGWTTITVRVPPDVKARFDAALSRFTGLDSERVAAVADAAVAWADREDTTRA